MSIAWAWPVSIETFGAHLAAYIALQPTILTLRLCNRFGQGPDAAITSLPVEIVGHIESYVLHNEYRKTRLVWTADYKCYSMQCEPIDHLAWRQRRLLYQRLFPEEFADSDDEDAVPYKLTKEEIAKLAEAIKDDVDIVDWCGKHEERTDAWHERVGAPTSDVHSFFTIQQDFILKTFGLQIWVAHERGCKNDKDDAVTRSTLAYLTLPHAMKSSKEWYGRCNEEDLRFAYGSSFIDEPLPLPTESGLATPITLPYPLSDKSRSRWPRALAMLHLQLPAKSGQPGLYARNGHREREGIEQVESMGSDMECKIRWPSLMSLVRCRDYGGH